MVKYSGGSLMYFGFGGAEGCLLLFSDRVMWIDLG